MRHVSGFSNSTRMRFIIDGFGMYATINDVFTKTGTVSHGAALRYAVEYLAEIRRRSPVLGEGRPVGTVVTHEGHQVQINLMAN